MMRLKEIAVALCVCAAPLAAQDVVSHQEWLQNIQRASAIDIDDPAQVLSHVLNAMPDPIRVQPTEHYSYFKFFAEGLPFQGNLRIEPENGPVKQLHFAYFLVPAPWHDEDIGAYKVFGPEDGISITTLDPLAYRVKFRGMQRDLILNDIRQVEPPSELLPKNARYLGQVNDESGLRFWLVFDPLTEDFAYFLDTNAPFSEQLHESEDLSGIFVGLRTGFVFIRDPQSARLRLIGVHHEETTRNTYYDGPFDQLPDTYQTDFRVGDALFVIDPSLSEEIDQYGNFINRRGSRVVIAPYLRYYYVEEFKEASVCAIANKTTEYDSYVGCLGDVLRSIE